MRRISWAFTFLVPLALAKSRTQTFANYTAAESPQSIFSAYGDRPDGCPPCFNCNLDDFACHQFAECSKGSGKCLCNPGFGGDDCSEPLCGSLADSGRDRAPRGDEKECQCKEGWEGINCNVCKTDQVCHAMLPNGEEAGAVCYREGQLIHENFQVCDITNKKILEQLKDKKPQATFSCKVGANTTDCNFQCMFHIPPENLIDRANSSSLGRPKGILLLRPGHVPVELECLVRP